MIAPLGKRRRLLRLVLVLVAGAVVVAVAWRRPPPPFTYRPARISTVLQRAAVALAPGVYLLGRTEPGVAYLVETAEGLVLIDSGLQYNAAEIRDQIAELQFDVKDVRAVLLTHAHADHSLGADHLRRLTGATVYAGRADGPPLRAGGPRDAFFSKFYMPEVQLHPTEVRDLDDGQTLDFGEARLTALATPGHSSGSVCYLLERPGLRALFTGDVVQGLSRGRGALGTYTAYMAPRYRGDARGFLASLQRLKGMPVPDLVLPGHPNSDPEPQRPHISEARWQALLDQGIDEMKTLIARYDADGADFLDGTPRELLPKLRYFGDLAGRAVYCLDSPRGLLLFDAPGGPELVKFLAGQFEKAGWGGRKVAAVLLTSADADATAGLTELVRESGCRVVVAKAGVEAVRRRCPTGTGVEDAEVFIRDSGLEGKAIPLAGRGVAPLAYSLKWAGKSILVSGRMPIKVQARNAPEAVKLVDALRAPGGDIKQYLQSLDRLAEVTPDVWLPAVPVLGQNANLYDDDWAVELARNRQLIALNAGPK